MFFCCCCLTNHTNRTGLKRVCDLARAVLGHTALIGEDGAGWGVGRGGGGGGRRAWARGGGGIRFSLLLIQVARDQRLCAGNPLKAATLGSTPGRDRVKILFSSLSAVQHIRVVSACRARSVHYDRCAR